MEGVGIVPSRCPHTDTSCQICFKPSRLWRGTGGVPDPRRRGHLQNDFASRGASVRAVLPLKLDNAHKPQLFQREGTKVESNRAPPAHRPSALPLSHNPPPPQWGTADAEITDSSPFSGWRRSVCSQGFPPCSFLSFRFLHLHVSKNLS